MKAKRIWIAVNPFDETDISIRDSEPNFKEAFYSSQDVDWDNPQEVEWQEYLAIPVET